MKKQILISHFVFAASPRSAAATLGIALIALAHSHAQTITTIEELFPEEFRTENYPVRRTPLEPEKRAYLEKLGVAPEVIGLYGDVHVTGYHSEHLRWGDVRPDDFGREEVAFNSEGMREFSPLADGSYPRVFCSDADREEHLNRLENTRAGQIAKAIILGYADKLRGELHEEGFYMSHRPEGWEHLREGDAIHPLFHPRANRETGYDNYASGNAEGDFNIKQLPYEAFRCWVYEDEEGARKAATVFATYLRDQIDTTANQLHPRNPNIFHRPDSSYYVAICFDLLHDAMTPEEQELARSVLYLNNYDNNQYGCFQGAEITTSNWASFSYRLISWLTLDGQKHANSLQYLAYVRGMRNFLTYGWFADGSCYEAMGKNQVGGPILYAMAQRGDKLAAHPHLLAHTREYMPHAIVPWGGRYVSYDLLGGVEELNRNDYLPLKALYPDDPHIDWVYRNAVGADYKNAMERGHSGYWDTVLTNALFLQDHIEGNDDPARLGLSDSFIADQRGLMITRSNWGKDAAYLHHHCRGACGGHTFMDRNSIIYGDKGRMWITFEGTRARIQDNSQVRIDDWRPASSASPGRMIDYKRTNLATFSCGDATPTYQWVIGTSYDNPKPISLADMPNAEIAIKEGWARNNTCADDFALRRSGRPSAQTPFFERESWLYPGMAQMSVRRPNTETPVQRAIRSVGLVRGQHPYAVIVDDIAADDNLDHTFTWSAHLEGDLVLEKVYPRPIQVETADGKLVAPAGSEDNPAPSMMTVELEPAINRSTAPENPLDANGEPKLTFRLIFLDPQGEMTPETQPRIEIIREYLKVFRLGLVGRDPQFRVILVATRATDKVRPSIVQTATGAYRFKIGHQEDLIEFLATDSGRTAITITREEGEGSDDPTFEFGLDPAS